MKYIYNNMNPRIKLDLDSYFINYNLISSITFNFFTTNCFFGINKTMEDVDINNNILLSWDELKKMKSGTLKYSYTITMLDGNVISDINSTDYYLCNTSTNDNTGTTDSGTTDSGTTEETREWYRIGYNGIPQYIMDGEAYAKQIYDEWDASINDRSYAFSGDTQLMFFPLVDTSNVTNMSGMFSNCAKLQYVPPLITSAVTSMRNMFEYCSSLTELDLSKFNTSNVTSMYYMFAYCNSLTSLDLSKFNTSNVTSMNYMFYQCSGLTSLDLSSFDTSNVTSMYYMFAYCNSLTSLDLSSFDTSNVTDMGFMFNNCYGLTSLDLSSFDTSKVTSMIYMFGGCNNLERVDGYLSLAKLTSVPNSVINTKAIRKITFKDLGYHSSCTMALFNKATNWGVNSDTITDARQSLIDSLITYSFNRANTGYSTCTVTLEPNSKAALTNDEIAQITAKGFTIA